VLARARRTGETPAHRARLGDPGIYRAEAGERVRVTGLRGTFTFIRYDNDRGGDYAVVVGGLRGHTLERCIYVNRVRPMRRGARVRSQLTPDKGSVT
jgi:hypothetical protein